MEAVFIVAAIVALLAILATKSGGGKSKPSRPPSHKTQYRGQPDRRSPKRENQAFDAGLSHRPTSPVVVTGAAYVVDGDTVKIKKTQIRLFGIDAPEMNHPFGKKSKWTLVALCKGQSIRAEITEMDDFGRAVARCYLPDGRDLSAEMVKAGMAIDWPKFSGGCYSSLEVPDIRKKLWLADARQKGRMHVWAAYEEKQKARSKAQ